MVLQMTGTHGLLLPEPVDAGLRVIALLICGHLLTRPSEAGRRILPAMTLLAVRSSAGSSSPRFQASNP